MDTTINIYRNDTTILSMVVTKNGTTFDLTGSVIYFLAKNHFSDADADAVINKNSANSADIVITNVLNGGIQITIRPSDTNGLSVNQHNLIYSVRVKDPSGNVSTTVEGILVVLPTLNQTSL